MRPCYITLYSVAKLSWGSCLDIPYQVSMSQTNCLWDQLPSRGCSCNILMQQKCSMHISWNEGKMQLANGSHAHTKDKSLHNTGTNQSHALQLHSTLLSEPFRSNCSNCNAYIKHSLLSLDVVIRNHQNILP